ncbi:MAG: aminotransferase class IV, partial [Micromonosporaceae bacterium]
DVYVRPLVFRGAGSMSLDPDGSTVEFAVAGWRLDDYFGADVAGIDATIATWARISPGSLVPRAKAAGHYLNSILAKADAHRRGFHEAILLDERGLVCEASAMNVFAVHSGCLTTPEAGPQLLEGITRDTVCRLASDVGADLVEGPLTVDGLRSADELLLTGTGARIVPVRRLDDRVFGQPGALTAALIERFDDVTRGRLRQHRQWLDPVAETRSGGRSWTSV